MYLSVPLPHAMERQFTITYIPANQEPPVRCVVSLNKQSRVNKLKEELLKTLGKEDIPLARIAMVKVFNNHIVNTLVIELCKITFCYLILLILYNYLLCIWRV
jgi:hypothetical protein